MAEAGGDFLPALPLEIANGALALCIGLHFVVVSLYVRLRWRRDGVGQETALLLPPDHPAAIPEAANERWTLLQENSLECLLIYVLSRTVFGGVVGHPQFRDYFESTLIYSMLFLDVYAALFLISRLLDTYFCLRGRYRASSFIVDISNFLNTIVCIAATVGYLTTVRVHLSWETYVIATLVVMAALFFLGALMRTKVRARGGENILDSLDLESIGFDKADFEKAERYKSIHRNLMENVIIFFVAATFTLPTTDERAVGIMHSSHVSETVYAIFVLVFLVSRLVHTAAFVFAWQPLRTIAWLVGVLSVCGLHGWFLHLLVISKDELQSFYGPFLTTHASFFSMVLLAIVVGIITFLTRLRQGVRSTPEDRRFTARVPNEIGVREVGAFLDNHRYVIEAIVLLSFAILAEELPGITYTQSMLKDWYSAVPIALFTVLTIANIIISLFPRTRRYNIVIFVLSYFVLLVSWAVEEYQYFEEELV